MRQFDLELDRLLSLTIGPPAPSYASTVFGIAGFATIILPVAAVTVAKLISLGTTILLE